MAGTGDAGEKIEIRPLTAESAARLTACFRRCYGDSYVAGFFYDPAAIRERLADGRMTSVVAATASGEIVGHMALTRRHAKALTLEAGNTVVDPRCRNQGLAARLGAALFAACREAGCVGFHHYPTTAHTIMQKLAVQGGGIETGVMLAYIPEDTDYRGLGGRSEKGRLAVVTVYQPIAPAPAREVHLPPRFAPMLRAIYERAGFERRAGPALASLPAAATQLRSSRDIARDLVRIDVERIGADLRNRIDDACGDAAAAVTHVDLLLSDAATPAAVEVLRDADFFFCALLPEFAAGDVLRLQRLRDPLPAQPDLVHAEAREILAAALADRERARAERPVSR